MSGQTAEESAMAEKLVSALGLDSVEPVAISPTAPLFGSGSEGLGLDSIDALEIALMIQQHYGIELRSDDPGTKTAFTSLRTLTAYVLEKRAA
ncbi:MAG TPA: phosphopantetheine-binding protein [Steroidobacteraceae bacterium]|nr:phosphopantetheine-binding protein [Steroidobacteraceae bacterium]